MLPSWHQDLESLEAISQDDVTRDLVLRMSAMSQSGSLGPFLFELSRDSELDDMTKSTLAEIAGRRPRDLSELGAVPGVGPTKLDRYADDVLRVIATCGEEQVEQQLGVAADTAA